jgi:Mrp family chromosome partitioning ATPase
MVRRVAIAATALVVVLAIVALANWAQSKEFVRSHDEFFKLVGLAIGPFLAIVGFIWSLADKAELTDLAEELGGARNAAAEAERRADAVNRGVQEKVDRIRKLEENLTTIVGATRLGKLRQNAPFPEYRGWKHDPLGAKIVTVGLFKGGVGKSHIAANFAAYVSEKQHKPVLLIDLDYQGSMSVAILSAAGIEPSGSRVDELFSETADISTVVSNYTQLVNGAETCTLNKGQGLSQAWIVPSDYTLNDVESRLLVDRIINDREVLDERYRLAHVLLNPSVRRAFALIILDTPPRSILLWGA